MKRKVVNFVEAVRLYHQGKVINCEIGGCRYTYEPKDSLKAYPNGIEGYLLEDNNNHEGPTTVEILHGTWFIEEDEDDRPN